MLTPAKNFLEWSHYFKSSMKEMTDTTRGACHLLYCCLLCMELLTSMKITLLCHMAIFPS